MRPDRYNRQLAPSDARSVPDFLNREHQKLEKVLDAIREDIAVLQTPQAAIADDASGALNQATVNAILAALRAYGIIA